MSKQQVTERKPPTRAALIDPLSVLQFPTTLALKARMFPMNSAERMASAESVDPTISFFVKAVAGEVAALLKRDIAKLSLAEVQPVLLDVKQAAVYLGRSEQSVQHLIFQKDLPVVRSGRRVHLHRRDLDSWIEKNTY